MRLLSVLIVHSLYLTITTVAREVSLSKPGCQEKCGNLTIPYPFGIGRECSANSSFTVNCTDARDGPKAFLSSLSNLEVREIDFRRFMTTVTVMQAVSRLNCSSSSENLTMRLGKSLVDSPFTFSRSYNDLVVVGCKSEVRLNVDLRNNSIVAGCSPICGDTTPGCNGINCCRTTIPSRYKELHISYNAPKEVIDGVCGYAFLVDYIWSRASYINYTSYLKSYPLNMSLQYVPMVLEWGFDISTQPLSKGVKCENWNYSTSLDGNNRIPINTTRCFCDYDHGYRGNPYLPGEGCQDLDGNNHMKSTIIGISSGTGALLLLSGAWMSSKFIRKRIKANRKRKFFKRHGGLLLEQQLSSNDGGVDKIKLFNSKELALATDHYNENRILGRGGQGTVYKGMLPDGRIVAVKKSKRVDEDDVEVFINEVVILSQINHRNIVKLLGCCLETEVPLLVYEFIPNGTLFQHIHDRNNGLIPLSWKMRVRIAVEVAGALSYLHNAASVPIYHRDIKSTNILLDEKYRAKVSDFGTSRSIAIDQTHLTTRVLGTFGYLDPEYLQSSQFTEKSDVYSFGVVMIELLTGEKAISTARAEAGKSLATHFLHSMDENHLFDILDPKVHEDSRTEEIVAVAKLARRCLNLDGRRRPTMKEVAAELVGIHMMKDGSELQSNLEDIEFNSIELSEVYDFPSSSDNTNLNVITAESSESPLLFGNK